MRNYSDKKGNIRKGLKSVHIGENVWLIGRQNQINGQLHAVIYAPDGKQYHIYMEEM